MDSELEKLRINGVFHLTTNDYRLIWNKTCEGKYEEVLNIMLLYERAEGDYIDVLDVAELLTGVFIQENRKDLFLQIHHFLNKEELLHVLFKYGGFMDQVNYTGKYKDMNMNSLPPISWMEGLIAEILEFRHNIKDRYLILYMLGYINTKIRDDDLLIDTALKLFKFVEEKSTVPQFLTEIAPVFIFNNKCAEGLRIIKYFIEKFNIEGTDRDIIDEYKKKFEECI